MTVLFCDIVDSTALTARRGPEGMQRLLSRFFELCVLEVERYGGTVNKFLGDGFMALVGVPVAHEDHARRAVLAALAIQDRLGGDWDAEGDSKLEVRMGLNTGRTLVAELGAAGSLDHTVVGETANVAARLQRLAEPGTIVMSDATARLVAGFVRIESLGDVAVRGRARPVTAFRVTGIARRRSPLATGDRPASRFVGRSRHLASLRDLLDEACAGEGQVVGVVGESGIGKTRLVSEFRRSLSGARVTFLEGRCLSYATATPYLPLLDILRSNCAIVEGEAPEVTEMKVRAALSEVGLDPNDHAPLLLRLLGVGKGTAPLTELSAEAVKTRTFETLLEMCLCGARRRPLVFVAEDLHWVDRTSEEFLSRLADGLAGEPMMLLGTYRPGHHPPWAGHSYATQLSLTRLASEQSQELVRSLLPSPVGDEAEIVVRRGEGNPLFLEELARAVRGAGGNVGAQVPDTLQGVLMARIDRLPDDARRILQTASVLGREFSAELLHLVSDSADAGPQVLELKRLEFLQETGDRDEPRYAFKHALIQEVAYESLLSARRRAHHAAAARALESIHHERPEQVYDRLAEHWYRAEEPVQAVEFLGRFAEQAAAAYAHSEASDALRKALTQVERLPEPPRTRRCVELVLALARSLYFMARFDESIALLSEHEAQASELADPEITGPYNFWLAHTQSHLGTGRLAARRHARLALAEAQRAADSGTIGRAHYVLSREGYWSGELDVGAAHGRLAVESLEVAGERWWLAQSHSWLGINLFQQGDFEAALAQAARAGEIGETLGDRRLESYAAFLSGWFRSARGEWEAGIRDCTRSLELSTDPLMASLARCILGFAYREKGDCIPAIELMGRAIDEQTANGYRRTATTLEVWLAEACLCAGRLEEAARHARGALAASEQMGLRVVEARARRALGEVSAAEGDLGRAEAQLGDALAGFTSVGARFDVGVTNLSLARAATRGGDRESARVRAQTALELFTAVDAPVYIKRARLLASDPEARLDSAAQ